MTRHQTAAPPDLVLIGHVGFATDQTSRGSVTYPGGSGFAAAFAAATLLDGVGLVAQVGEDFDLDVLRGHHIGLAGVAVRPGVSARFRIEVADDGNLSFHSDLGVAAGAALDLLPASYLQAKFVHLGSAPPEQQLAWLKILRGQGCRAQLSVDMFEPFVAAEPAACRETCARADLIFLNDAEYQGLYRETPHPPVPVIRKYGPGGAAYLAPGVTYEIPAPAADEVDPVGAGEILAGTFLALRARGLADEPALSYAVAAAARSVTEFGVAGPAVTAELRRIRAGLTNGPLRAELTDGQPPAGQTPRRDQLLTKSSGSRGRARDALDLSPGSSRKLGAPGHPPGRRRRPMDLMTIGAFAGRTRLSAKALRLYDRLGLLPPARVDPDSGYRFYREDQVATARLIALLRRLDMPLTAIADVAAKQPGEAAAAVAAYWAGVESATADRRILASYIQARLTGGDMPSYDITTRALPRRPVLSISRHLHMAETNAFFADAFARLRSAAPGLEGIAGCPYLIFYGEVSDDSDGPLELCRPVAARPGTVTDDVQVREEPAHTEAYIRVAMKDMGWPALAPAVDALEAWVRGQQREPAGALRQVLIGDQRTAAPDTPVCDLSIPLK